MSKLPYDQRFMEPQFTSSDLDRGYDLPTAGHRLVFVCGLHRSGTTPLTRCLAAHPAISGFSGTGVEEDEGQHLQDVYPPARDFGGPGRFAVDGRSRLTESSPLASPSNARRLAEQWAPHWDLSRPVLVEKSPPNIVRTRFLHALFPQASFVVVVRHPVVVSLSTHKWARRSSYRQMFANWFAAHEALAEDAQHVQRLHVLKYEDLVTNPTDTLSAVAAFLGLDGNIPADTLQGGRSSSYQATWQDWADSRLPWRRQRVSRLRREYGHRVSRFGYSLDDLDRVTPVALRLSSS
jgi:hypothetical protein